jgi:hypothetical protein
MSIHLESKDLSNAQQMEVAVNGPDGATHLILCTGIANLSPCRHEIFTFLVGPSLSRRQFVGVIASGALSTIQMMEKISKEPYLGTELSAKLVAIIATYEEESGQVKVSAELQASTMALKLSMSYNVSILAELPIF